MEDKKPKSTNSNPNTTVKSTSGALETANITTKPTPDTPETARTTSKSNFETPETASLATRPASLSYNGMDGKLTEEELSQDRHFMERLNDNIAEMKNTVAAGAEVEAHLNTRPPITEEDIKQLPMTEAEAKALLIDETHKLEQNLQKTNQKPHKTLMLVMVIAVALCIAGIAFTLIMSSMHKGDRNENNNSAQGSTEQTPSTPEETKKVELGLDNALVRGLYEQFNVLDVSDSSIIRFYKNGLDPSERQKYIIALGNLSEMAKCDKAHRLFTSTDDNGTDQYTYFDAGALICRGGEQIREMMQNIFGGTYDLVQFDNVQVAIGGDGFVYFTDGDEVVNVASGASFTPVPVKRELYKAEQEGDNLYLYEVAAIPCVAKIGTTDCSILVGDYDKNAYEQHYHHIDLASDVGIGEHIDFPADSDLENLDLKDYVDQLDRFKWTFTRADGGNYVFESLKRISD